MTDRIPLLTIDPPTRFLYPENGYTYLLTGIDYQAHRIVLERGHSPAVGAELPRLQEAAPIYIQDPDEGKLRCTLTEEIEEDGKFLRAKYYKNSVVPE